MPRTKGVSSIQEGDAAKAGTVDLSALPTIPKLAAFLPREMGSYKEAGADVTLSLDLTGSYELNADVQANLARDLGTRIDDDPETRGKVRLNLTVMSGIVKSTGFFLAHNPKPINIIPGGVSPYPLYIRELMDIRKAEGNPKAIKIDVIFGDFQDTSRSFGSTSNVDEVGAARDDYRAYQEAHGVHTFVVTLKHPDITVNYVLANTVSVSHEIYDEGVSDVGRVFDAIFALIKAAINDPTSMSRTRSLKMSDLQAAARPPIWFGGGMGGGGMGGGGMGGGQ